MDDVVAVVTDLFFQSRIAAAARATRRPVRFVTSEAALANLRGVAVAVVDLDAQADVLEMIRALKRCASGPVIAFGPHVDTEKRKAARAAGADRVLAKSRFVTELPTLMARRQGGPGDARLESETAGSAPQE